MMCNATAANIAGLKQQKSFKFGSTEKNYPEEIIIIIFSVQNIPMSHEDTKCSPFTPFSLLYSQIMQHLTGKMEMETS